MNTSAANQSSHPSQSLSEQSALCWWEGSCRSSSDLPNSNYVRGRVQGYLQEIFSAGFTVLHFGPYRAGRQRMGKSAMELGY
jgi:hypothetical protein